MSKELKIVLIAGGTFVGLILIIGILGVVALSRSVGNFAREAVDPKNVAAVNAKIANFTVPPGYVESTAFSMLFTSMATIEPARRAARGHRFQIELQAIPLPGGALSDEQTRAQMLAGVKVGLASRCSEFHDAGTESIVVRGKPVEFTILECNASAAALRAEVGIFSANAPYVSLLAVGPANSFDAKAIHQLLASIH